MLYTPTAISAEEYNPAPNECPGYNIKQFDEEIWGNVENPFIAIAPRSTLSWSGTTL